MALQLTSLPPELLQTVLQFAASDAKILLNTEKSCRALRQVVAVDATWKFVPTVCRFVVKGTGNNYVTWKRSTVGADKDKDFLGCTSHRIA